MSDFDDEPTEGAEANDVAADDAPTKKPRSQPVPDDDWDDDWDDEDTGRGGKRDLTLVYAVIAAAVVIVLAVVLTRPNDDNATNDAGNGNANAVTTTEAGPPSKNWQGGVGDAVGKDGADAQKRAESAPGIYVWTDFGGWHLRANGDKAVNVTVAADQVRVKKTDDGDDGDESADTPFSTEATVTLPAGDGKDGIGLDLGNSESATFTFTIDGANVPADQIFVGGAQAVADQNPVTFTKA